MKKGFILLFIAIGIVAILLSFTITKTVINGMRSLGKNNTKETISKVNTNGKVEIISHQYIKENFKNEIEIKFKNNTGKTIKYITIIAHCYDKDGNNLGDYTSMKSNINTNDIYKTSILCKKETNTYKLELKY